MPIQFSEAIQFAEQVANLDLATVMELSGCDMDQTEFVAFSAWMMVYLEVLNQGPQAVAKYASPKEAFAAYVANLAEPKAKSAGVAEVVEEQGFPAYGWAFGDGRGFSPVAS